MTDNGKLNVMGIFSNINAREFPAIHNSMVLVIRFRADAVEAETTHKVAVKLVDADGGELLSLTTDVKVPKPKNLAMPIEIVAPVRITNASFPRAGLYAFKILIDDNTRDTISLSVTDVSKEGGKSDGDQT